MRGAIPPLPQYVFMAWCLIKQWVRLLGVVLTAQVYLYYCMRLSFILIRV
jgi:hypothetical protein